MGLVAILQASPLLMQKREFELKSLEDLLDEELTNAVVCIIVSPCDLVVTSSEAVKDAQSGNEFTRMIKEVLVSGQTEDTKQYASIVDVVLFLLLGSI